MKCLSLFSGIGGFDLALKRAGHQIIGACEIDKYARTIYSRHFPGVTIYEDATKIKPEELPDFEILCAGFPCQAFSIAGKRLGFEESRGTLFFEIARIAKQKRPRLLLLENVKGLLSHDRGKTFANILATLDELGYDAQWQVLNSKYFVPQNRERIFIICYLRGTPRPEVFPIREDDSGNYFTRPETQEDGSRIRDKLVGAIDANYHKGYGTRTMIYLSQKNSNMKQRTQTRDTSWTLTNNSGDFGIVEPKIKKTNLKLYENYESSIIMNPEGIARTLKSGSGGTGTNTGLYAIPKIKSLGSLPIPYLRRKEEPNQKEIAKYLRENKTITLFQLSETTKITKTQLEHYFRADSSGALPNKEDWLSLKKALHFDNKFDKIMTEYVEDVMTHEMGTRVHDSTGLSPTLTGSEKLISKESNIRRLTPLECERLQGFPDGYTEGLSDTQRYKCLGNAVTVSVIEFILERLT